MLVRAGNKQHPESELGWCRASDQTRTYLGFLDANIQLGGYTGYELLTCPSGYLVVGYEARAYAGGIDYIDASP